MAKKPLQVLMEEIFSSPGSLPSVPRVSGEKNNPNKPPTRQEAETLAKLILEDKAEEAYQQFLNRHPHFLIRGVLPGWNTITGMLMKPGIGELHTADFAVFSGGQSGPQVDLIEIEKPTDTLFTRRLTPSTKLRIALGQLQDWREWLSLHPQAFLDTSFRRLERAEQYPRQIDEGSFYVGPKDQLKMGWNEFGGIPFNNFTYTVVIGRWSKLNSREQEKLLHYNTKHLPWEVKIKTYDNFIRDAVNNSF